MCPFFWGSWVPIEHNVAWPTPRPSQWHLSPIQLFGHNGHWPIIGGCVPFGEGELGLHLTQCRVGRRLPPYQAASSSLQPFGHNRRGLKIGGLCPLFGDGELGPHNTAWPGPRPTCMPSFILIRPTVRPQYDNVRDRTGETGQDRTTVR